MIMCKHPNSAAEITKSVGSDDLSDRSEAEILAAARSFKQQKQKKADDGQ